MLPDQIDIVPFEEGHYIVGAYQVREDEQKLAAYGWIDWRGCERQFVQLLLNTLISYGMLKDGRNALVAVLEAAKQQVGSDRQAECNRLIAPLRARSFSAISSATSTGLPAAATETDVLEKLYQTFKQEGPDEWMSSAQICKELNISQEQLNDFIFKLKINA